MERAGRPKRSVGRLFFKLFFLLVILVLLGCVVAGALGFLAYQHITQPGVAGEPVNITIPEGANGKDVARILTEKGLVEHEAFFRVAMHLDKSKKALKQGWYRLPRGLSPMELLHLLQQGSNRTPEPGEVPDELRVTVPEGLSLAQAPPRTPP